MITVTINTATPAFKPAPQLEAARILRALADKMERAATVQDLDKLPLRDRDSKAIGLLTVKQHHEYDDSTAPCIVAKLPCGHYFAVHTLDVEDLVSISEFIDEFPKAQFEIKPVSFVQTGGLTFGCGCK